MEFPRQASICQEGLRTPSQREAESFTPPPFHNAFFNALFIPPAEESGDPGINSSSPLARSGREAYKIYLPTRPRSFSLFNPSDNCITSHCACPPTLSPIVGSPPLLPSFLPSARRSFAFFTGDPVSLPLQFHSPALFVPFFSPPFSFCARRQSECPVIERKRVLCFLGNWNFLKMKKQCSVYRYNCINELISFRKMKENLLFLSLMNRRDVRFVNNKRVDLWRFMIIRRQRILRTFDKTKAIEYD